ncbi:MAG: pyridoxamine 5'-phosphate oxidase family protein [Candidatus Nitrosocosmicus sp.]
MLMFTNTVGNIMKILNTFSGMGEQMIEDKGKRFMTNNDNILLIRLGIIDEKGKPNVAPFAYYYDNVSNGIYFTTRVTTKKVSNLRRRSIVGYCIHDPDPPFKGVRDKGIIKIHEDVTYNITIAKTIAPIEEVRVIREVDPVTR